MNVLSFVIGSFHLACSFQDSQNLFIWRGIYYYLVIFEQCLPLQARLALNLTPFCSRLLSAGTTGMCHYSYFIQLIGALGYSFFSYYNNVGRYIGHMLFCACIFIFLEYILQSRAEIDCLAFFTKALPFYISMGSFHIFTSLWDDWAFEHNHSHPIGYGF